MLAMFHVQVRFDYAIDRNTPQYRDAQSLVRALTQSVCPFAVEYSPPTLILAQQATRRPIRDTNGFKTTRR